MCGLVRAAVPGQTKSDDDDMHGEFPPPLISQLIYERLGQNRQTPQQILDYFSGDREFAPRDLFLPNE